MVNVLISVIWNTIIIFSWTLFLDTSHSVSAVSAISAVSAVSAISAVYPSPIRSVEYDNTTCILMYLKEDLASLKSMVASTLQAD